MKKLFVIILTVVMLISCQKEKAESPAPFLIGEWEFYMSFNTTTGYYPVDPNGDFYHYLKIDDRGKVFVYKKDGLIEKGYTKQIELSTERTNNPPYPDYFSYKWNIKKTSCFKEDYIINGIEYFVYWPWYNVGLSSYQEIIKLEPNEYNGNDIDDYEMYYKRKL